MGTARRAARQGAATRRPPAFVPGRRSPPAAAPLAQGGPGPRGSGAVPGRRRRIGRHGALAPPARQPALGGGTPAARSRRPSAPAGRRSAGKEGGERGRWRGSRGRLTPARAAAAPRGAERRGPGRRRSPEPPRSSLTWPVPPARVHPPAQPAFLGRGAVAEWRQLRA